MLIRTPEPELMDDPAQATAYAQADFAIPHELCVDLFAQRFADVPADALAVDLGCGPADVTLRFARRYPGMRFHGIDGAAAMLAEGEKRITQAGMQQRIRLTQLQLPSAQLANARYDIILSNSLLHHLHDPGVLWQAVKHCARPGTIIYIMDLFRPDSITTGQSLVDTYADGEPEILRRDFYQSLLAAFTPAEVQQQLAVAGISGLRIETVSDRHMIISGRR